MPSDKPRENLWPHPKLDEKFQELLTRSEQISAKFAAALKEIGDVKSAYHNFEQECADTVRMAIMQRDNAEAAERNAVEKLMKEKP